MKNYYQITNKLNHFYFYNNKKDLFGNNLEHVRYSLSSIGGVINTVTGTKNIFEKTEDTRNTYLTQKQAEDRQRSASQEQSVTDTKKFVIRNESELESVLKDGAFGRTIDLRNSQISPEVYMALAKGEEVSVKLQQTAPERNNLLTPLFASAAAVFMSMNGNVAYNDKLMSAIQNDLDKSAEYVDKHGLSYDFGMGFLGGLLGAAEHVDVFAEFNVVNKNTANTASDAPKINLNNASYTAQKQKPEYGKAEIERRDKAREEEIQLERWSDKPTIPDPVEYQFDGKNNIEFKPSTSMSAGSGFSLDYCIRDYNFAENTKIPLSPKRGTDEYKARLALDCLIALNGNLNEDKTIEHLGSSTPEDRAKLFKELGIKDSSGEFYTASDLTNKNLINSSSDTVGNTWSAGGVVSHDKVLSERTALLGKFDDLIETVSSSSLRTELRNVRNSVQRDDTDLNLQGDGARLMGKFINPNGKIDGAFRADLYPEQPGLKGSFDRLSFAIADSSSDFHYSDDQMAYLKKRSDLYGEKILNTVRLQLNNLPQGLKDSLSPSELNVVKNMNLGTMNSDLSDKELNVLVKIDKFLQTHSNLPLDKQLGESGNTLGDLKNIVNDYLTKARPLFNQVSSLNDVQKSKIMSNSSTDTFLKDVEANLNLTPPITYEPTKLQTELDKVKGSVVDTFKNSLTSLGFKQEDFSGLFSQDGKSIDKNKLVTLLAQKFGNLEPQKQEQILSQFKTFADTFNSNFNTAGKVEQILQKNQSLLSRSDKMPELNAVTDVAQLLNGEFSKVNLNTLMGQKSTVLALIPDSPKELKDLVSSILDGKKPSELPDNLKALLPENIKSANSFTVENISELLNPSKLEIMGNAKNQLISSKQGLPLGLQTSVDEVIKGIDSIVSQKDSKENIILNNYKKLETLSTKTDVTVSTDNLQKYLDTIKNQYTEFKSQFGSNTANELLKKLGFDSEGAFIKQVDATIEKGEIGGNIQDNSTNAKQADLTNSDKFEKSFDDIVNLLKRYNNPSDNLTAMEFKIGDKTFVFPPENLSTNSTEASKQIGETKTNILNALKQEYLGSNPNLFEGRISKFSQFEAEISKVSDKPKDVPIDMNSIEEFANNTSSNLSKLEIYLDQIKSREISKDTLPEVVRNLKNIANEYTKFIIDAKVDVNKISSIQSIANQITNLKVTAEGLQGLYEGDSSTEWGAISNSLVLVDQAIKKANNALSVINKEAIPSTVITNGANTGAVGASPAIQEDITETTIVGVDGTSGATVAKPGATVHNGANGATVVTPGATIPNAGASVLGASEATGVKPIETVHNGASVAGASEAPSVDYTEIKAKLDALQNNIPEQIKILSNISPELVSKYINSLPNIDAKAPILDKMPLDKIKSTLDCMEDDTAPVLNKMSADNVSQYIKSLPGINSKRALLEDMEPSKISEYLKTLSVQDASNLVLELPTEKAIASLKLLDNNKAMDIIGANVNSKNPKFTELAKAFGLASK